ncbi:uncharacterized protein EDB93DRAFT_1308513 [Suillus bovinus]|uniref:uncharacterized protein n=1 Tax=Suillus bovinus TaxID=48563 RepID=UPI001B875EEE|nr:uncharacterized protein EDB93DRAFT_1308513 [Suillus bovinus]KAG2133241.1 hypothetical protein EDB93DRAFT_1308513 [Suillus bovinus]
MDSPSSPIRSHPSFNSMTLVSNDPSWWPVINANLIGSYFIVASCAVVIYDWGLMFGQEVELIWRQRWSTMTVLYLVARYVAIGFALYVLTSKPFVLPSSPIFHNQDELVEQCSNNLDDRCSLILYDALCWTGDIVDAILGVIMIARLYAMYQGSRKVLIFLVVIFLVITIADIVMVTMMVVHTSGEEFILSGTYLCNIGYPGDVLLLTSMTWILETVWEVLALCLAVWIAVKHFRELRQHSAGGIIGDCFTVLMQTHISYFASFLAVSCFHIGLFSPTFIADGLTPEVQIYLGFAQILEMVQMSVLGPRLILSVREYHAKLVADSDIATAMTSIAFQERVHVETSTSV